MKRTLITITTTLLLSLSSFAQYRLQNGEDVFYTVVSRPYFFYDLMRDQLPSWIRQYRTGPSSPYSNANKLIHRKHADGRFERLEYNIWNFQNNDWEVYNSYSNDRVFNNNEKAITENINRLVTYDQSIYTNHSYYEHTYSNNRISQSSSKSTNERGIEIFSTLYFQYNEDGKLLCDSEAYLNTTPGDYNLTRYFYNENGKCIAEYRFRNGDSVTRTDFTYSGERLSSYTFWVNTDLGFEMYLREEYDYDHMDRITDVRTSYTQGGVVIPWANYKHGYDGNSKRLSWMCNYNFSEEGWQKSDSVVMTYTGDKPDTSYGYLSANGESWHSLPAFRFLFDSPTGIKENTSREMQVSIYPNPATKHVSINITNGIPATQISITDLSGRVVLSIKDPETDIDITSLAKGIYILNITGKAGSVSEKLLIE